MTGTFLAASKTSAEKFAKQVRKKREGKKMKHRYSFCTFLLVKHEKKLCCSVTSGSWFVVVYIVAARIVSIAAPSCGGFGNYVVVPSRRLTL